MNYQHFEFPFNMIIEQFGIKSSYWRCSELPSFSLWNNFFGRLGSEISGVFSSNDSSEALSSVLLELDWLEVSVLSAGGLGMVSGFSLGVFKACKIDGDSEWPAFNGSWFLISCSGGLMSLMVFVLYLIFVPYSEALVAIILFNGGWFLLRWSRNCTDSLT